MMKKILLLIFSFAVLGACNEISQNKKTIDNQADISGLSKDALKRKLFESYMKSPEAKMLIPTGRIYEFDRNLFCYIGQTEKYHIVRYSVSFDLVPSTITQKKCTINNISQFLFYDKQFNYVGCSDYSCKVKTKYYDLDFNEKGEKILVTNSYIKMGANLQSCLIRGNQIVLVLTDNHEVVHKKFYKTEPESYFFPTQMLIEEFLTCQNKKTKLQSDYDNFITEREDEVIFLGKIKGYYLFKINTSSYTQVVNPSCRVRSRYQLVDENFCFVDGSSDSDLGRPKFAMIKKGYIIASYNFTDQLYKKMFMRFFQNC